MEMSNLDSLQVKSLSTIRFIALIHSIPRHTGIAGNESAAQMAIKLFTSPLIHIELFFKLLEIAQHLQSSYTCSLVGVILSVLPEFECFSEYKKQSSADKVIS